jgi:hypothetical protein
MNFDFNYPSSFHAPKGSTDDAIAKGQSASSETKKPDPGCVSVPVAVMDMRTDFNMIFLKRYDTACLGKQTDTAKAGSATDKAFTPVLEHFAAGNVLTDALAQFGKPAIGTSTYYDIAGHSASTVSGSVKAPHSSGKNIIYGAASCVISGNNIACFEFLSNDCPTLAVLSASTVKFTDAAATPVIPARSCPLASRSWPYPGEIFAEGLRDISRKPVP